MIGERPDRRSLLAFAWGHSLSSLYFLMAVAPGTWWCQFKVCLPWMAHIVNCVDLVPIPVKQTNVMVCVPQLACYLYTNEPLGVGAGWGPLQ